MLNCHNNFEDNKHSFIVVLTATINPGEYKLDLERNSPEIRLEDYKRALLFWGKLGDSRLKGIVFCENSGANLCPLKNLAQRFKIPVELVSFDGNAKPPNVHYGYSELGIIDYALHKSTLLEDCPYFIKATGRLTFPRISKLLNSLKSDFDAVIDHRRKYGSESGSSLRVRTELMVFSTAFYILHFIGCRDEMVGRYSHIEEFLAVKLGALQESAKIIKRFEVECQPAGFSAFDNKNYNSVSVTCKNRARALARRLFPSLWI